VSDTIQRLHVVPPPRVGDVQRSEIIAELERALEEARSGDITEIMILIQHANPKEWSARTNLIESFLTWIGRLEVAKFDIINRLQPPKEDPR
jgi:hypothetical protein